MREPIQENNLDIEGRVTWVMAPDYDAASRATVQFTVAESGRFSARPNFYSKREGRDGYLILYTESGKGLLKYGGDEYELTPGSAVLINCHQRHEYKTFNEENVKWTFCWIHIYGEIIYLYTQLMYRDSFTVFELGDRPLGLIEDIFKNLQYITSSSLMLLSESVHKILTQMIEASHRERSAHGHKPSAQKAQQNAVQYIKDNYWIADLSVDKVAKHAIS